MGCSDSQETFAEYENQRHEIPQLRVLAITFNVGNAPPPDVRHLQELWTWLTHASVSGSGGLCTGKGGSERRDRIRHAGGERHAQCAAFMTDLGDAVHLQGIQQEQGSQARAASQWRGAHGA